MATATWDALLEITHPYHQRFRTACDDPEAAQRRFLAKALHVNRASGIGRQYKFEAIRSPQDFLEAVPVHTYGDLEASLAASCAGRETLSGEPVVHVEYTSGSTCPRKAIPYSEAGLDGFHEAIFPWLYDLAEKDPEMCQGRIYWSISPRRPSQCDSSDAAFLGPIAHLLPKLSAVPLTVGELDDPDAWRFWTAFFLAAEADLSVVSVWSPTFLFPLFDAIVRHACEFAAILRGERAGSAPVQLRNHLPPPDFDRASTIEACAREKLKVEWLWPRLRIISCWADGDSRRFAVELARRCPGVEIRPKGLFATEAAMSVPVASAPAPVLAVNSAFFELHRADGTVLLAHQLREGDQGILVVTTRSGLWRYRTGDRVRVAGVWQSTPCIEFLGRDGVVCDLCGEKLDEAIVAGCLPETADALLAPIVVPERRYLLFLDARVSRDEAERRAVAAEDALCGAYHYGIARKFGQLDSVKPVRVHGLLAAVIDRLVRRSGAPLGAVKPPLLHPDQDWWTYFSDRRLIVV